jgi:hypothetical protein
MTTDVRRAVLQLLGTSDSRFGRRYFVTTARQAVGCTDTEVWESLWSLVADRLVYLDPGVQGSGTDNWHWRLSSDGQRAVQGGTWEPRDPDGYMDRLRRMIPSVDAQIEMYLTEALLSFNARCYLATSLMLGVAAERAFLLMSAQYAGSSLQGADQMARELKKPRNSYFGLWTEFRKQIEPIRNGLPDGTADPLTLDAVADLIRLTRNDVGHPTGRQVDEDTARVHLTIAPSYLQKMAALTSYFAEQASR